MFSFCIKSHSFVNESRRILNNEITPLPSLKAGHTNTHIFNDDDQPTCIDNFINLFQT